MKFRLISLLCVTFCIAAGIGLRAADKGASTPKAEKPNVEWNQWGGSAQRNNTPVGHDIPTEWEIGEFDYRTGEWDPETAKNIKWVARLGSQTYGNPVVV